METTFVCPKGAGATCSCMCSEQRSCARSSWSWGIAHHLLALSRGAARQMQMVLAHVVSNGGCSQQLLRPREIDPRKLRGSCQHHSGGLSRQRRLRSDKCLFSSLLVFVSLLLHQTERHRAFPGGKQEQIHRLHSGTVSVTCTGPTELSPGSHRCNLTAI